MKHFEPLVLWKRTIVLMLPFILLIAVSQHYALFYDTIQFGGDVPNWFFFNEFSSLLLPDYCDSGHPPGFGLYLAVVWKVLGRSLAVSHWAMLPFVLLLVYQSVKLGAFLFKENLLWAWMVPLLILSQAPVLTQAILVSPDIVVLGAALWMLTSICTRNHLQLALAVLVVALVSNRGMFIAFILWIVYTFGLWWQAHAKGERTPFLQLPKKTLRPFLIGGIVGGSYLLWHYFQKGWISPTDASTWANGFELVPLKQLIKHQGVLIWRIIDVGNVMTVFVACALMMLGLFQFRKFFDTASASNMAYLKAALLSLLLLFCFTVWPLTLYQGLLSQRYLMFFNSVLLIIGLILLAHLRLDKGIKIALLSAMFFTQLSGHFWRYPATLSVSWDCTLGHMPYYNLRKDFMAFMKAQNIAVTDVATEFPMHKAASVLDYADDTTSYIMLNTININESLYIWYSNVCNALLKQKAQIELYYDVVKYKKQGAVEMILYKRKNQTP